MSVITAVATGGDHYLLDAWESLASQTLPDGWDAEWLVQEDGLTGSTFADLPSDPRIRCGVGRRGGAAQTRNLALARASGDVVRNLDADDVLPPGALARDLDPLTRGAVDWTCSAALDLLPDGVLTPVDTDPDDGPLPLGTLLDGYELGRLQVVGTTVCARASLVFALGGWPAMPASEDVGLLLALNAIADGWFTGTPGLWYRKGWPHQRQATAEPTFRDPTELQARRVLITRRATALRFLHQNGAP